MSWISIFYLICLSLNLCYKQSNASPLIKQHQRDNQNIRAFKNRLVDDLGSLKKIVKTNSVSCIFSAPRYLTHSDGRSLLTIFNRTFIIFQMHNQNCSRHYNSTTMSDFTLFADKFETFLQRFKVSFSKPRFNPVRSYHSKNSILGNTLGSETATLCFQSIYKYLNRVLRHLEHIYPTQISRSSRSIMLPSMQECRTST